MTMKCYYEILNVEKDASDEELKKSYRKLALLWHPDKNLERIEEAKEQFQLVQQAYEVLSDPQERAWYDRHRDSILKGGLGKDFNDDTINLYPYFTSACFKGFGDDEKGFYSVYREVFNKISAEDSQFESDLDSEDEIPDFGDSQSPYEAKVHLFYSYWQSYTTKRSFSWLDEYDTRTAPNRRVARLMEKENKKIRDAARKERNEQVRALVSFVRKRDKRVQLYSKLLEERAAQNADKVKQIKLKQKLERQEEIQRQIQSQSEWAKFSNFEKELKEIEENLAEEFKDDMSEEYESNEEEGVLTGGNLYCSACNKIFKTEQAFENHEKSKKHRDKVEEMMFDDASLESPDEDQISEHTDDLEVLSNEDLDNLSEEEIILHVSKKNKKKKKAVIHLPINHSSESENEFNLNNDSDSGTETTKPRSRKNRRKQNVSDIKINTSKNKTNKNSDDIVANSDKADINNDSLDEDKTAVKNDETKTFELVNSSQIENGNRQKVKPKKNKKPDSKTTVVKTESLDNSKIDHICKACTSTFKSNNELFKHLKKTGHAMPKSSKELTSVPVQSTSKSKKKNKN